MPLVGIWRVTDIQRDVKNKLISWSHGSRRKTINLNFPCLSIAIATIKVAIINISEHACWRNDVEIGLSVQINGTSEKLLGK